MIDREHQHVPVAVVPGPRGPQNRIHHLVDIIVMHDGDESAPRKDQRQAVDATARLITELRAKGFDFGTVCRNEQ